MTEQIKENDKLVLYIGLVAIIFIGVLLAVKSNENDKFAPIKAQIENDHRLMNIRILN